MSDGNKAGGTGDVKRDQTTLSAEQKAAVAGLAAENVYTSQSKWRTFRELPANKKWWFFKQHFLLPTVAIVAALALIIGYVVTVVTRGPDPELSVVSINLKDYTEPMERLKAGFVEAEKIDDERLVDLTASLSIDESGSSMMDDSMKLVAQMTAGQINASISDLSGLAMLVERGDVSKPLDALGRKTCAKLAEQGALVDKNGKTVDSDNLARARALDLSKAARWAAIDGMPDEAYFMVGNVVDDAAKERVKQFVDYLYF